MSNVLKVSTLNLNHNLAFTSLIKKKKNVHNKKEAEIKIERLPIGNIYGTKIHKYEPVKPVENLTSSQKICKEATDSKPLKSDLYTLQHQIFACDRPDKRWVFDVPLNDILNRSLEDAINSNLTLVYGKNVPEKFPSEVKTPDYGDKWGRHANYIEINNRALSDMRYDRSSGSILNTIKLLPLIPPSHDNFANCILISQLYPNIWGDGWNNNGENSLYGIKLEYERLSDNIGYNKIGNEYFSPEDQVKLFNDIAHLRGFKTSFRMLISEDQIKLGDSGQFRWNNPDHVEAFIIACCKGIELGFDGIFFDSAKHVGGYDWGNYAGVGAVPTYEQMAYILNEIRTRTNRTDLSFSGEKAENDSIRYKNMGFSAGTSSINAKDIEEVKRSSDKQAWCDDFAWGPVVSDDNDTGAMNYNERLERIKSSLYGYRNVYNKLPSFMQMHDLFPLNYSTNTHKLMLENQSFTDSDRSSHFDNLFAQGETDKNYSRSVANEFSHVYKYKGG